MSEGAMMNRHDTMRAGIRGAAVMRSKSVAAGFTLLELMVVVAVIAIIAAIALPAYTGAIAKTNRRAAEACLSQLANYMERYYTTNMSYAADTSGKANSLPTLDCMSTQQTGNNYTYTLPTMVANDYKIQAAPTGVQASRDTLCGTLTLNKIGTRTVSGTGTLAQCW